MARRSNKNNVVRALFAKSGNRCAFPGCNEEMVTSSNVFVGQICHIEAASPGGARYNPFSTNEERHLFRNLMLMCYKHHHEIDNTALYDVGALQSMKHEHERSYSQNPYKVNEAFLYKIERQMDEYWAAISNANEHYHVIPELAVHIATGTPASEQFMEVYKALERLSEFVTRLWNSDISLNEDIKSYLMSLGYDLTAYDAVPYYSNPFFNRNWEIHFLGVQNSRTDVYVGIKLAEVRFLEEFVKSHPTDTSAIEKLESVKCELKELATSAGYAD
ncbi:MAG TPA: hypothetical protein VF392_09330 [Terracidiphilus sp.]